MSELAVYNANENESKYIIFKINKEVYAIDVKSVNNIIQMPKITQVPSSPKYYRGVINLRGEIIPVMSLRRRMNYDDDCFTSNSRIIILNIGEDNLLGIVVDEVNEVLDISSKDIEQPSQFIKNDASVVSGVGKIGDMIISILSVDSMIGERKAS
ncbi:purine-binding chemotaxis protein CheW [Butyrivibrio sp. Su6]|uniref:chemotaxis protein CheW n=1 Tax=unclassified Butyrivibrio TaxID=2639466 RepID=UPI0003B6036E|nr:MULTISPECIES: chemotaxis protein CheW [unclassified Butyrivibrio]SEF50603.1 purine-binding chemotaxis protein CheW [Butyrivibrio sp. Su6]